MDQQPELHDPPCDFMYTITGLDTKAVLGVAAARLMDRFSQFAVLAAREAVADAGLDPAVWGSGRVAVVIGSAHGGLLRGRTPMWVGPAGPTHGPRSRAGPRVNAVRDPAP